MPYANTSTSAGRAGARVVGGYELLRVIGRGGMATVHLARQPDLHRLVALKELGGLRTAEPSFAQRFVREARVAGGLSHPNIVTVHDYFQHAGTPYIAMEYVAGGTLRPHMADMSMAATAGVLEGVLAGLAHAEQHGIVHRDLKPENLLVASDGRVKIADFGIAKATGAVQTGSFRTETGTAIGTPTYIAPEQAMGEEVGPWTDLYSLGIIAFEMLVGYSPFHDSDTPMAVLMRHINEPIPPLTELRPDLDPEVSDWVERLLEKDPSRRTQSAVDAWDEFEDLAIGMLGARWRDGAALVGAPEPDEPWADDTAALSRTGTTSRTARTRALAGSGPPLDAFLDDTAAVTAMPRSPGLATTVVDSPRRRTPLAVLAALLLLAIVAGAAAFAAGGGGNGGGPAAASATPPGSATSSPGSATVADGSSADSTNAVLERLRRSTARDEATLAAATNLRKQARAARVLAADYEVAADRLAGGSQPRVVAALRQIAAAYRVAAAAAARGDSAGFAAAGNSVDAGQLALDEALAGAAPATQGSAPAPQQPAPQQPAPQQPAPQQPAPQQPAPQQAPPTGGSGGGGGGPCAGDSVSDDPSDDSCGGGA